MIQVLAIKVLAVTVSVAGPLFSFMTVRYLNNRWRLNLSEEEQRQLSGLAREGVQSAEQQYKHAKRGQASQEKYQSARAHLRRAAAQRGIDLDEKTTRALIEESVYKVNYEEPGKLE